MHHKGHHKGHHKRHHKRHPPKKYPLKRHRKRHHPNKYPPKKLQKHILVINAAAGKSNVMARRFAKGVSLPVSGTWVYTLDMFNVWLVIKMLTRHHSQTTRSQKRVRICAL
jgi:hypothetical protein